MSIEKKRRNTQKFPTSARKVVRILYRASFFFSYRSNVVIPLEFPTLHPGRGIPLAPAHSNQIVQGEGGEGGIPDPAQKPISDKNSISTGT